MQLLTFYITTLFTTAAGATLLPRQASTGNQQYIDSVCSPNVTSSSGTLPPCISVQNIETQCQPNGTQPLAYLAHAECICSPPSSFFADWLGCRRCLFVHGALNQQDIDTYSVIISSASNALCTGTPTASFAAVFSSVAAAVVPVSTGSSVSSDRYPSQTAVSLYYTASGSQGPGAITGSATAATRAATASTASGSTRASGSGSTASSTGVSASTSRSASGTSTSSSGGQPTAGPGGNVMAAMAAGMIIAAL